MRHNDTEVTLPRRLKGYTTEFIFGLILFFRDYAMLNWIKNRLFPGTTADDFEDVQDKVEENFSPVGVRVNRPTAERFETADTYVAGYTVNEAGLNADDEFSATVNDIKTTGVDPYNTGHIDLPDAEKSVPEK